MTISLAAEVALDVARATYPEAMGYSEALDRFRGEVTDETREIRHAARALLDGAEHDAREDERQHAELADHARSLGHPRPADGGAAPAPTCVADHRVAQPDDEPERSRASAAPADAARDAFTRRSPGNAVPAAA